MPTDVDIAIRILVAMILGAVIGLERELTGQNAGLRTHITIALGAALFAITSAYSFSEFVGPGVSENYQVDVTRIASNIVTGVGFLGGGAIIKHGASVSGLTTAASMWVTAAVGLAVGLGSYFAATVTSVVLIFVLTALRAPRRWLQRHAVTKQSVMLELTADADAGEIVNALFNVEGLTVSSVSVNQEHPGQRLIRAEVKGSEIPARLAQLAERDDVTDLDVTS